MSNLVKIATRMVKEGCRGSEEVEERKQVLLWAVCIAIAIQVVKTLSPPKHGRSSAMDI